MEHTLTTTAFSLEGYRIVRTLCERTRSEAFELLLERAQQIVEGRPLPCGHFIPEEAPGQLLADWRKFLRG